MRLESRRRTRPNIRKYHPEDPAVYEIKEEFELILVDDGSKDRSFEVMKEPGRRIPVKIIQMARNFGQHPALLCGFAT